MLSLRTQTYFRLFTGGRGSQGGKGRRCRTDRIGDTLACYDEGVWDTRAPSGPPGKNGRSGTSKEIIIKDSSYFLLAFLSPQLFYGLDLHGYPCVFSRKMEAI